MTQSAAQPKKVETVENKNNFSESFLFDPGEFGPDEISAEAKKRRKEGNRICAQIYKIRRETISQNTNGEVLEALDKLIRKIQFVSRLSDFQMEELVLYAIEKRGCFTIPDICEEISLCDADVKRIVEILKTKNLLYETERYVPLSGRQYFALKSRRVKLPEAGEVFSKPDKTYYSNND